jgi:hypothetical protein
LRVFDTAPRSDRSPKRANETTFAFLDRCAVPFFGETRDLLEDWLSRLPAEHRAAVAGSVRSGSDAEFESAFWEMFLHEAYRRSGHRVTVHPDVPGAATHPDFLLERDEGRFYLEAVRVGRPPQSVARDSRLADVHAVLDAMSVNRFTVSLSSHDAGRRPLSTGALRSELRRWLGGLDPDEVAARARAREHVGFAALPRLVFAHDGWRLEFHAMPLSPAAEGKRLGLVGASGAGRAQGVDNLTGLRRVLAGKANRYGRLDAPLVIAVLANTEFPTRDYEVEQALFGVSAGRPADASREPGLLFSEGHWLGRKGWRRGHAPHTVFAQGLQPWFATRTAPRSGKPSSRARTRPPSLDGSPAPTSAVRKQLYSQATAAPGFSAFQTTGSTASPSGTNDRSARREPRGSLASHRAEQLIFRLGPSDDGATRTTTAPAARNN